MSVTQGGMDSLMGASLDQGYPGSHIAGVREP